MQTVRTYCCSDLHIIYLHQQLQLVIYGMYNILKTLNSYGKKFGNDKLETLSLIFQSQNDKSETLNMIFLLQNYFISG